MEWKDEVKAKLGKNATFIWLVGGATLFLVDGGPSHLFSWPAAAFLGVGMFAAAVVVGGASYGILTIMVNRLNAQYADPTCDEARATARLWRGIFAIMNVLLAVLFLVWVYASFFRH